MKLTGKQIEDLTEALLAAYNQSRLAMMLQMRLNKRLDVITAPGDLQAVVFDLIGVAEMEGWTYDLIREAHDWVPGNALLADFVASLPPQLLQPATQAPDPFQRCFLYDMENMAFVNRIQFRNALESLDTPGGARVVTVDGPPDSGKSYSFLFVSYLSEARGNFEPIWVDLTETPSASYGPDDLARRIALQMGVNPETDPLPEKRASDPRWVIELCDWLVGQVRRGDTTWWIVLDGILQVELPDETLHFVRGLAQRAALTEPQLRLVLLSYRSELLPPNTFHRVLGEELEPLQRLDLKSFFEKLLTEKGIEFEPDAVDPAVQYVINEVPPPYSAERLARLPGAIKEAAEILLS
ncbi:MAG: effector-associated domain EAD1-containing protein [Anaerolineae bacterium]|jgi:hypothetical protein